MAERAATVVQLRNVIKDYRGLRPLRIRALDLVEGQSVALLGVDAATAEVIVNLVTAGALPDTGDVIVFGQPTAAIADRDSWIRMLDRLGLVSERSILLDQLTAEQNLAMPFSLTVHSMTDELRREVRRIADEVAIGPELLKRPVGELPPAVRVRVRLGRALALGPQVLVSEHPNAFLSPAEAMSFAADLSRIAQQRHLATLTLTADRGFALAVADEVLMLQPATGHLARVRSWWPF
jgi:ABC-type transporter Mla maintaining outer membrane lipid asymmetry ATPase subunit MlaF